VDANLLHTSSEGKLLEDPSKECPEDVYQRTVSPEDAPDKATYIEVEFEQGDPVSINGKKLSPEDLLTELNDLGGKNGIGRLDMVENRSIGMKSRGIYETPGGTILLSAHRGIEQITLDREACHLKDEIMPRYAKLIYNGFWFSPEMDFIMCAMNKSQEEIDGVVRLALYKGNVTAVGRESPTSLYDQNLSSMEVEGGFDAQDAEGFIKINAIRLKAHNLVLNKKRPYKWRRNKKDE
jgi:argininosuccinate synthase